MEEDYSTYGGSDMYDEPAKVVSQPEAPSSNHCHDGALHVQISRQLLEELTDNTDELITLLSKKGRKVTAYEAEVNQARILLDT